MNKSFYITTTLPYANAKPHLGFAMEIVRADAIARFKRLQDYDVFFNTGTDEHGQKIAEKAKEEGLEPKEYLDKTSEYFRSLKDSLNISYDKFIRTTDEDHKKSAQEFWNRCKEAGYIYKKKYSGLYCVGDEMFLKEKDLVNGRCPNHPNKPLINIEEENYFFAFSKFEEDLKNKFVSNPDFITPDYRAKEMVNMIEDGLEDFSISRLKEKVSWGVPVPDDDEQVIYVWFDALANYISTLGWPDDKKGNYKKFWEDGHSVQICGKDNTQHQSLRWQAMLMSIGLPTTNQIIVNGFINAGDGQKMSKSLGNVVDPEELVEEYGIDALRYFVLRELHPHEDSAVSMEKLHESYNAHLANGIGNLTNRILKMAEDNLDEFPELSKQEFPEEYVKNFDNFNLQKVCDYVWNEIGNLDALIQEKQPFKIIKEDKEAGKDIINNLVIELTNIGYLLEPLIPDTSNKILEAIKSKSKPVQPLFDRK